MGNPRSFPPNFGGTICLQRSGQRTPKPARSPAGHRRTTVAPRHKSNYARRSTKRGNAMKNLYVGNLPHSTTEAELRTLFETHGAVEKVSVVTDRETGRARGVGFVEMTDASEAEKAIAALNGPQLGGRALTINEAKPKTDRPKSGGGGGQRFGGGGGGGGRGRDDYQGHARQPREPRW